MFSHIRTVKKKKIDTVQWKENWLELAIKPFPILKDAEVGEKYRIIYETDNIHSEVISVEKAN